MSERSHSSDNSPFSVLDEIDRAAENQSSGSEKVDPLLAHLTSKYTQQRHKQLNELKRKVEHDQADVADKANELNPSLELLSDYAILMMNELETLCAKNGLNRGVELVREIRAVANNDLRQAVSSIENGYTSAFQTLQRQAAYKLDQEQRAALAHEKRAHFLASSTTEEPSTRVKNDEALLRECPNDWKANVKQVVVDERKYQSSITRGMKPTKPVTAKQFSFKECCSAVPSFFAESLASLLLCEVVRIYLYDEFQNLHCCATYPYHAVQGDPMHATYTEIMLAKDLHNTVCSQRIAVNGTESVYTLLTKRDLRVVKAELQASGWGSMRSCLIFPIIPPVGATKSLGMIHCVNKVAASAKEPGRFTSDDEVLCSMACRLLGCILTRYPVANFSLRVGEMFRKTAFPHEDTTSIDDHIPERVTDLVTDAAEAGNRAVATPVPIMIFRAPLCDIYVSKHHRTRVKKMGKLVEQDSTLSSVEFNISSVNELWQTGMEENVVMHQEYRKLEDSMKHTNLLLRNILDGLAAARTMRSAAEITTYLQTLELFGRSESVDMLSEFISETLLGNSKSKAGKRLYFPEVSHRRQSINPESSRNSSVRQSMQAPASSRGNSVQASVPAIQTSETNVQPNVIPLPPAPLNGEMEEFCKGGEILEEGSEGVFLTEEERLQLVHDHKLLNSAVASRIHTDGPDCIRCYSCDPAMKRAQVRFIENMLKEGEQKKNAELNPTQKGPAYLNSTASIKAKKVEPHIPSSARIAAGRANQSKNPPPRPFLID